MPNITKKMVEAGKGSNVEVTLNPIFSENSSKLNLNLLD